MAAAQFEGFDVKGLAVLADLEHTNTKQFFDGRRTGQGASGRPR
ncbi:hypothetical protein BH23ACT10_BH23ACT10_24540 [soil metagenome]